MKRTDGKSQLTELFIAKIRATF